MAESVVSCVAQKLAEQLLQEVSLLRGVDSQVRSLHRELEFICSFLKDADRKSLQNEGVKVWISQLTDAAYEAEDVIDTFIQQQHQSRNGRLCDVVKRCIDCIIQLVTLHHVAMAVEDIKRRLQEISGNARTYGIKITEMGEPSGPPHPSRLKKKRASVVEESDIVGFKDDEKMIAEQLTRKENRRLVVSIVGMGGQGKTTLAKKVYNRSDVKNHFDCHAWISVSQEYQVKDIIKGIIKDVMLLSEEMNRSTSEELSIQLSAYLKEKKYLVVVDDIWTMEAWADLSLALPDVTNGSRILLTTRIEDVALVADRLSVPNHLRFLTESESWELFCKKTFLGNVPSKLLPYQEKIGRELVAKCGRLPLAIVILGGILCTNQEVPNEWERVRNTVVSLLLNEGSRKGSGIPEGPGILTLSYHELPYHLKPCFLYFGVFPEDSEILVRELIRMWIAEGFVKRTDQAELEDVAEQWLEELVDRSLVQVVEREASGALAKCRVHDLLRELSISKADEIRFLNVYRNTESSSSQTAVRRLAITYQSFGESLPLNHAGLALRSFFTFYEEAILSERPLKTLCQDFKMMRVMNLKNISISFLPNEIGYLVHLRYLSAGGMDLRRLPNTVTGLYNLQTLDVSMSSVNCLPNDAWKMRQLRHLLLSRIHEVNGARLSAQLHRLSNLQTLYGVSAGSWLNDCVGKLTSLRGLEIHGKLSEYSTLPEFIVNLVSLRYLQLRALNEVIPQLPSFSNHDCLYDIFLEGRLLKPLELHELPPNLCKLRLSWSRLRQDPMEVLGKLPNLQILILQDNSFIGKEMVSSVGGFPHLKTLEIGQLEGIEEWKIEEGAMRNLKNLAIWSCKKLKMLPQGLQDITTLQELRLELGGMTADFKGRVKERDGADWHKIRHIPSRIIEDADYLAEVLILLSKQSFSPASHSCSKN